VYYCVVVIERKRRKRRSEYGRGLFRSEDGIHGNALTLIGQTEVSTARDGGRNEEIEGRNEEIDQGSNSEGEGSC